MAKKLGKIYLAHNALDARDLDLDALVEKCVAAVEKLCNPDEICPHPKQRTSCVECEARAVLRVVAKEARNA